MPDNVLRALCMFISQPSHNAEHSPCEGGTLVVYILQITETRRVLMTCQGHTATKPQTCIEKRPIKLQKLPLCPKSCIFELFYSEVYFLSYPVSIPFPITILKFIKPQLEHLLLLGGLCCFQRKFMLFWDSFVVRKFFLILS